MLRQRSDVDKSARRVDYQQAQYGRRKAANERETAVHARGTVAIDGRGKRRKPGGGKRRKKHKHRSRQKHRRNREKTVLKLPRASRAANAPPPLPTPGREPGIPLVVGRGPSAPPAFGGGGATAACKTIGAEAYATGNSVAFGGSPTLHTAAHEAAHVIQQRAGVSLSGGVGRVGDTYEQHADAVADLVVQGKSAEGLLDGMAPTRGQDSSSRAVQRVSPTHEHGVYGGGHKGTNDFKFADGNGLLGKLVGKLFKRIINKRHEILDKLSLIPGPIGKGFKVAKLTLSIVEAAIEKDPSKLLEFFGENFKGNLSRAFKPEGVNIEELEVPEGFQKLLKELEENTKQLQNTHELQQPNQDAGKDDEEAKPQGNSR